MQFREAITQHLRFSGCQVMLAEIAALDLLMVVSSFTEITA